MSENARAKVRAAVEALEEWEDDLDRRQVEVDADESDAATALSRADELAQDEARLGAWEVELHGTAQALQAALDWARDPNPAMGREEQRLVLRTLLFDVAPHASFTPVAELARRMLP